MASTQQGEVTSEGVRQGWRWIAGTLGVAVAGAALVVGSTCGLDLFGVFRPAHGRALRVWHNERTAKPFLNLRYVPENFDALVIGGSSTSNWPMDKLDFAHFYNESLFGANAVEEDRLLQLALQHGHIRYAIVVITPYLFMSHEVAEGNSKSPRLQALGSMNVLREEVYWAAARHRHSAPEFFPDGGRTMPQTPRGIDVFASYTFQYDPVALHAMQGMLDALRAQGAQIIFLETPVFEPLFQMHKAQFDRFYSAFPLRKPGEPLIDFGATAYTQFRAVPTNWMDGPHLTDAAAEQAAGELNRAIHAALPALPQR